MLRIKFFLVVATLFAGSLAIAPVAQSNDTPTVVTTTDDDDEKVTVTAKKALRELGCEGSDLRPGLSKTVIRHQ